MVPILRSITVSLTLLALVPNAILAQAVQPTVTEASPAQRGEWDGSLAGRGIATGGWLATGLFSGIVAGPIGAGINFAVASSRDAPLPPDSLLARPGAPQSGAYREAFTDAYRARIRNNRKTAALVGGVTGSAIFAFIILQLANWDGGSGSSGGGGGGDLP